MGGWVVCFVLGTRRELELEEICFFFRFFFALGSAQPWAAVAAACEYILRNNSFKSKFNLLNF